jgi:hypothetical protein
MCISIDQSTKGWDRCFLTLSSLMTEPICEAFHHLRFRLVAPLNPKLFECRESISQELVVRVSIVVGAALGVGLVVVFPMPVLGSLVVWGGLSKVLRTIGFSLQKNNFTHVRGNGLEKVILDDQIKVMSWNVCGPSGGMTLDHGGVVSWRGRS